MKNQFTLADDKSIYHYTSRPYNQEPATPYVRRYSAVGKVIQNPLTLHQTLVVAFSIASEKDEFVAKKGLKIAENRLQKYIEGNYNSVYQVELPQGVDPEKAGIFFNEVVHNTFPLSIFNIETQSVFLQGTSTLLETTTAQEFEKEINRLINISQNSLREKTMFISAEEFYQIEQNTSMLYDFYLALIDNDELLEEADNS